MIVSVELLHILHPGEVAAYSLVPPGTANYEVGPALAEFKDLSMDERMEKAKALLGEAGFGDVAPVTDVGTLA